MTKNLKNIPVENFIRKLNELTYGKSHKEMTINITNYLSELLMIEPPNIKFQNEYGYFYDCKTRSLELPNKKFLEHNLQEYISYGIAHELMHHAICIGRKVNKNIEMVFEYKNKVIWIGDAEEAAAEKFGDIIFNLIEMIDTKK